MGHSFLGYLTYFQKVKFQSQMEEHEKLLCISVNGKGRGWMHYLFISLFICWSNRMADQMLCYYFTALCTSKGTIIILGEIHLRFFELYWNYQVLTTTTRCVVLRATPQQILPFALIVMENYYNYMNTMNNFFKYS